MIKQNLPITLLILIVLIFLFGITDIDFVVQNHFFDFETKTWILDRDLEPYKFIFYDGVKKLLILFVIVFIIALVFFKNTKIIQSYKKGIIIVILSAIFVPLTTSGLKKYTNMPCPKNTQYYGGDHPKTTVWEKYPKEFIQKDHIRCWPAGHASGGFALLSLFFLFKSKKNKFIGLALGLTFGFAMGIYKMLIGDHFLSHTLITMILAWLIVSSIAKLIIKE